MTKPLTILANESEINTQAAEEKLADYIVALQGYFRKQEKDFISYFVKNAKKLAKVKPVNPDKLTGNEKPKNKPLQAFVDGYDFRKQEDELLTILKFIHHNTTFFGIANATSLINQTAKIKGYKKYTKDTLSNVVEYANSPQFAMDAQEYITSNYNDFLTGAKEISKNIDSKTSSMIYNQLYTGIENLESMDDLAVRVGNVYDNCTQSRALMIARTETMRSFNTSTIDAYKTAKIKKAQILIANDERTCDICMPLNGLIMPVDEARSCLPMHPDCYDKKTEIYTKDGWRLIKEVEIGEKVLTLNPGNKRLEWGKVINRCSYYEDKILSLKNKQNSFDMKVSKNHPFFGYRRVGGKRIIKPKFYNSINELPKQEFRFYISSKWQGQNKEKIVINDIEFKTEDFCRLLGYYLSEGSTVKRKSRYQISIAQSKYLIEMWNDLKNLPVNKVWLGKDKIFISDNRLGMYLIKFGKSYEKYIPNEIKRLSKKYIRIFLNAFLLGDGTTKKGKMWKGSQFGDSLTYFTTSKRLADDLGELIIKSGKSVSYNLKEQKGEIHKFKNGIYKLNYDCWVINELKSKYKFLSNIEVKEEKYSDLVYDVEVNKNHTILTRRNGKVVWGSNCRCTWISVIGEPILKEPKLGTVQKVIEKNPKIPISRFIK